MTSRTGIRAALAYHDDESSYVIAKIPGELLSVASAFPHKHMYPSGDANSRVCFYVFAEVARPVLPALNSTPDFESPLQEQWGKAVRFSGTPLIPVHPSPPPQEPTFYESR